MGNLYEEDLGGLQADLDFLENELFFIEQMKKDRSRRVGNLIGKYIVTTQGISSGHAVFYQDKKVSKEGFWTQYLSNAFGFSSLEGAKSLTKKLKYNNPRVALITGHGTFQYIN